MAIAQKFRVKDGIIVEGAITFATNTQFANATYAGEFVIGSATANNITIQFDSGGGFPTKIEYDRTDQTLDFTVRANHTMTMTENGWVGINEPDPFTYFHVTTNNPFTSDTVYPYTGQDTTHAGIFEGRNGITVSILTSNTSNASLEFGDDDYIRRGRITYFNANDSLSIYTANTIQLNISNTGVATFTSIPVLPASNPTTSNQAVRKAYADSLVANGTNGYGSRFISNSSPTGGANGDIWYQVA